MTIGLIRADTSAIESTGAKLTGAAEELQVFLQGIVNHVDGTQAHWQGNGQEKFRELHARWDHHSRQLQIVLAEFGKVTGMAARSYVDNDVSVGSTFNVA